MADPLEEEEEEEKEYEEYFFLLDVQDVKSLDPENSIAHQSLFFQVNCSWNSLKPVIG